MERAHDLKLHRLAIKFDRSDFLAIVSVVFIKLDGRDRTAYKVNTNRRDVAFSVCVVSES